MFAFPIRPEDLEAYIRDSEFWPKDFEKHTSSMARTIAVGRKLRAIAAGNADAQASHAIHVEGNGQLLLPQDESWELVT